jgi:hypothetical protein
MYTKFCPLATVLEEPSWMSEGRVRVLVGSRNLGRGGNRESRREEVVTIEVQVIAPLLDLGGANRSRRGMPKVSEKAQIQGWTRRKLPRQESLRPRNSSGSLTS